MKVLITGANGMLAKSVREKLGKENELICTDVAELDITDREAVVKKIRRNKTRICCKLCSIYSS